jgi:methylthioribose-1-phosphate isomerase
MAQGREAVLAAALELAREDEAANRELSRLGADWLLERIDRPTLRVLTHCNTGSLATSAWGTALGVIRELHARGRIEFVYADETRPLLQGARLTAYELASDGIPHAVQADGAAASTILRGLVDFAVVGADRIAANGDAANKIGTLGVALACRDAEIPFMVAAPWSTVDVATATGEDIEIEERDGAEVTTWGGIQTTPVESPGFNPAFDVTPARLIAAIATERGVVEPRSGGRMDD